MQRVHAARALKADHVHCGAWQLAAEGEVWLPKSCRSSHWLSPSFSTYCVGFGVVLGCRRGWSVWRVVLWALLGCNGNNGGNCSQSCRHSCIFFSSTHLPFFLKSCFFFSFCLLLCFSTVHTNRLCVCVWSVECVPYNVLPFLPCATRNSSACPDTFVSITGGNRMSTKIVSEVTK